MLRNGLGTRCTDFARLCRAGWCSADLCRATHVYSCRFFFHVGRRFGVVNKGLSGLSPRSETWPSGLRRSPAKGFCRIPDPLYLQRNPASIPDRCTDFARFRASKKKAAGSIAIGRPLGCADGARIYSAGVGGACEGAGSAATLSARARSAAARAARSLTPAATISGQRPPRGLLWGGKFSRVSKG